MKFVVSSSTLVEHLQVLSRVISNKNTLPIMNYFLFSLEGSKLTITASDQEITMLSTIEVENKSNDGRIAILPKYLLDILHELGDQPLAFEIDESNYAIVIKSAKGKYSFIGHETEEYPAFRQLEGDVSSISIPCPLLLEGLSQTLFAVANDDLRPIMTGVCFDITTDSLNLVGTDAHTLSRFKLNNIKAETNINFVLPQKAASLIKNVLSKETGDASMKFDDKSIFCEISDYILVCRQIEGTYPKYNSVIPQDNPIKVIVDRLSLLSAIRRVSVCTNQGSSLMRVSISNGNIYLSGQDIDFSVSGEENVSCQYDGEAIEIGFKAILLIDMLSNMSASDIVIELSDKTRPGIFSPLNQAEGTEALMLLMPMMI